MNKKNRKTLIRIFTDPVLSNIPWKDVETLLKALGAEIDTSSEGSRVRVILSGVPGVFHRPHPRKETEKGAVHSVRKFLLKAGVTDVEI